MDGTLLNDDHEVSEYTKKVIAKVLDQGDIHVVLSTGRWFDMCYPFAELLNLKSYLVTVNGGEIWSPSNELIEHHLLDASKIEQLWNIGEEIGLSMWMASTTDIFYAGRPDDFYAFDWLKFGCDSKNDNQLKQMREQLSHIDGIEVTNSLPTNLEVNPEGVNKAAALEKVCAELNITMNEVMAVGDSLNDIKMIEQAGLGVAMENAQEVVKQVADYETETNNNHGVAKAIEHFVL